MAALIAADASTAFFPIYAEDTYTRARLKGSGSALISPPPDARLGAAWRVRALLTASDVVLGRGP